MGILQTLGIKKRSLQEQNEITTRKNEKLFEKYKSKPNETFYIEGITSGTKVPYHYNENGEVVSGESEIVSQGFESEDAIIETTEDATEEETTEDTDDQAGVVEDDESEDSGASQEQEEVQPEIQAQETDVEEETNVIKTEQINTSPTQRDFVTRELYLTMSAEPQLTDAELLEKFPEFNGDTVMLRHFKKYALSFEGEYGQGLKKKDETIVSEDSGDGSVVSESEVPTTSQDEPIVPDDTEAPSVKPFDVEKFKSSLINVESSGKVDYSLINPTSSAVGPYQFLYNTHKDVLKSKFKVNSKKDFIGNKEAQEGLMNYMLEDKPGRYPFMAKRLVKDYGNYMPEGMNVSQLTALQHYVGHGDLRKLFARVRDEKDFKAEDIYNVTPSGQNMPIGEYLKRMTPEEEGMYIGMENPLDDPNLMAAGEGLPPGDYSYDSPKEIAKNAGDREKAIRNSYKSSKLLNLVGEDKMQTQLPTIDFSANIPDVSGGYSVWKEGLNFSQKLDKYPILDKYLSENFKLKEITLKEKALHGGATPKEISRGYKINKTGIFYGVEGHEATVKSQIAFGVLEDLSAEGVDINDSEELRSVYSSFVNPIDVEDINLYSPTELLRGIVNHKYKIYNSIINGYKNNINNEAVEKYKITTPGFEKEIQKLVDDLDYTDIMGALKLQHISIDENIVIANKEEFAHQITMGIYNAEIQKIYNDVYERFEKAMITPPDATYETRAVGGPEIYNFKVTKEPDYVFRAEAEEYLKGPGYDHLDDSQGGAIDYMVEGLWRKYVEEGDVYKANYENNLNKEIEKYNSQFDYEDNYFLMPAQKLQLLKQDLAQLQNNPILDFEDIQQIVAEKHDVFLELGNDGNLTMDLSPDYIKTYNAITSSASEKAWSMHPGPPKRLITEALDRSLFGQIYRYIADESINPDQGVIYTTAEEIGIGIGSIVLDPVFIIGGPLVGKTMQLGAKALQAKITSNLAGNVRKIGDALYRTNQYSTRAEANLAALNMAKAQKLQWTNRIVGGTGYASSATTLGLYESAFTTVEKQLTHEDWETEDYKNVGKSYIHGNTMGIFIHGIGSKVSQVNRKLSQYNLHRAYDWPLKGSVYSGGVAVETIGFQASELMHTGGIPEEAVKAIKEKYGDISYEDAETIYIKERLAANFATVLGLKGNQIGMKLVSGNYKNGIFYDKISRTTKPGEGELAFQLTEAERYNIAKLTNPKASAKELQSLIENPNFDRQFLDGYISNINNIWSSGKKKGEIESQTIEMINSIPLNIQGKLIYSSTGMGLKFTNPMDAQVDSYENEMIQKTVVIDGKEVIQNIPVVNFKNDKGLIIGTQEYSSVSERTKHLEVLSQTKDLDYARAIVENNMLDISNVTSMMEFKQRLREKGLTKEVVESILNKEKIDIENPTHVDAINLIKNFYKYQNEKRIAKDKESAAEVESEALQNLANEGILNPTEAQIIEAVGKINSAKEIREALRREEEGKIKDYAASEFQDKTYVKTEKGEMVKGPFGWTFELGKGQFKKGYTSVENNVKKAYELSFEVENNPDGVIRLAEQMIADKVVTQKEVSNVDNVQQLVDILKSKGYDGLKYKTLSQKMMASYDPNQITIVSFNKPTSRVLTEGTFKANKENIDSFVGETKLQNELKNQVKIGLENGNLDKAEMHTDLKSFREAFKKEYPNDKTNPDTAEGFVSKDGTVHFNVQNAGSGVGFHETGHKIVNKLGLKNPEKLKVASSEIIELIETNPELVNILDFVKQKSKEGESVYNEKEQRIEAIVELAARMAKGEIKLDKPGFINNVKKVLNKFLDSVGMSSMKVATLDYESATSFVNEVAKTLKQGDASLAKTETPVIEKQLKVGDKENYKSKIKKIKQDYNKKIKEIKGDIKAEKDAVKKVKENLLDFINTSEHINKDIRKSLVKEAIKVNTPKKLERFIGNVEVVSEKQLLSTTKSKAQKLIKTAKKRGKKGLFGDKGQNIQDFLSLDISKITDINILNEYNKILTDLNRPKQPLIISDKMTEVTNMVNKHLETIAPKEIKPITIEQVDKKLNENITEIEGLTAEGMMDLTSLEGVDKIRKVYRKLSTLEKQLTKGWETNTIPEETYLNRLKQIEDLRKSLDGTVTEYNTQVHDISKGILSNLTPIKSKTIREQEQINYFLEKTSQTFVDNPMFNDQVLTASLNLSNGFVPVNNIVELNNHIRALENSKSITGLVENRVDKWGGQKVYGSNIFGIGGEAGKVGIKDVIAMDRESLERELSVRPLALLSDYYRSENVQWKNKNAGAIDKHIVDPFLQSFSRLTTEVENVRNNWAKTSISSSTKAGRRKNTKIGMLLAQIERNTGDGANVVEAIISSPKKLANYNKQEQAIIKEVYNNLPKKEVDGKVVIDVDAAISQLSSKERKVMDAFRSLFDNNLMEKQKYANFVNGIEFTEQSNYFPHLIKGKKSELNTLNNDWKNAIFDGNTKIQSDAGKGRTTSEILPYEFDINKLVENRSIEVLRDYHLSETIKQFKGLMINTKLASGEQYHVHYDALTKRMKEAVELQLTSTAAIGFGPINTKNLMQANYHLKLLRPGRLATEFFSENYRMLYALEKGSDLPKVFEAWSDRTSKTTSTITGGIIGMNKRDRYIREDGTVGTTMENLMDFTNSPFVHKFNRHDIEYNKDLGGKPSGYITKVNNYLLGLNDRNTMHMAYMPAFRGEFKRLSGVEFNSKEFNTNPDYRNQYKNIIKESAAIGNREAGKWKNIGVKGAGRSAIRIPSISFFGYKSPSSIKVAGDYRALSPLLTYMGSFGALEAAMYQKNMRDFMIGESANTRATGGKNAAGIFSAGVAYGIGTTAEFLLMDYMVKKWELNNEVSTMQFARQETKESFLKANNDALDNDLMIQLNRLLPYDMNHYKKTGKIIPSSSLKTQVIGNAGFLMTTKYSQLGRTAMILAAQGLKRFSPSKEDVEGQNLNSFLWKQMGGMGITKENIDDFVGYTMYTKPTGDVKEIAAGYLPHIHNLQRTVEDFDEQFFTAYNALKDEKVDERKVIETFEKYREQFAVLSLLNSAQKMYLTLTGSALPGQKLIDSYLQTQFNIYNLDYMSAGEMKYQKKINTFEDLYDGMGVWGKLYLEQREEKEGPMTREEKREALKEFNQKFNAKPLDDKGGIKVIQTREEDKFSFPDEYWEDK